MELVKERHDGVAVVRVEAPRRLVREEERGLACDRPRDGDALLLASGELAREVARAVAHLHALERPLGARAALGAWDRAVRERELHVLDDVQISDQVEGLEDEADAAIARLRPHVRRERLDAAALEGIGAARRDVQEAQDRKESALAGSGGSLDAHELAGTNHEVHVGQRVRLDLVRLEQLRDAGQPDNLVLNRHLLLHRSAFSPPRRAPRRP